MVNGGIRSGPFIVNEELRSPPLIGEFGVTHSQSRPVSLPFSSHPISIAIPTPSRPFPVPSRLHPHPHPTLFTSRPTSVPSLPPSLSFSHPLPCPTALPLILWNGDFISSPSCPIPSLLHLHLHPCSHPYTVPVSISVFIPSLSHLHSCPIPIPSFSCLISVPIPSLSHLHPIHVPSPSHSCPIPSHPIPFHFCPHPIPFLSPSHPYPPPPPLTLESFSIATLFGVQHSTVGPQ